MEDVPCAREIACPTVLGQDVLHVSVKPTWLEYSRVLLPE